MVKQKTPAWPRLYPLYTLLGLAVGVVAGLVTIGWWKQGHAPQWFYLWRYLQLEIWAGTKPALYSILLPAGQYQSVLLSPIGFKLYLEKSVYPDGLFAAFYVPLLVAGVVGGIAIVLGGLKDEQYNDEVRHGRLIRGPEVVTHRAFNRRVKGDGLDICGLRIRKEVESNHIQICGGTGSGKTSVIRDILYQVEERGDTAIIFDPDREFVQEFYREDRGDWVLNPKDERCPYWPIGEEAADEAEATAIAVGMFPDGPTAGKFFQTHARAIMAYLLAAHRPTVEQLCSWLADERAVMLIDRLRGTEHAGTLRDNAAGQRQGILGELNIVAKPLRMMPDPDGRRVWTAKGWAADRRGWIFVTSTPDTDAALKPLQSLWLDMLILKLQNGETASRRVWLILDEVATLQQLPQLHSALTRQRKSGNPIVLGFQGMSQIEHLYGDKLAETILSQAYTNIILWTREGRAARHLSDLIGKQELERMREHRPAFSFSLKGRSFNSEKVIVPAVMESEIQVLPKLSGYFVQTDQIVKVKVNPRPKRIIAPALLDRVIPIVMRPGEPAQPPPEQRPRRGPRQQWPAEEERQYQLYEGGPAE